MTRFFFRPGEDDEIDTIKKWYEEKRVSKDDLMVPRKKRHSQKSVDLTKTELGFTRHSPSLDDLRLAPHSKRHHNTHRIKKAVSNTTDRSTSPDNAVGSVSDVRDSSVPAIRRSISITLPNQLNHKLRKRIHTTNYTGEGKGAEQEFRIRSSRSSKSRHEDTRRRDRGRKYSDLDQPSYSLSREPSRRDVSHRKKHYSSFQHSELLNLDHQLDIQGLAHHYNEVERRNRAKREKHRSYVELPGISDLARRHQDLQVNKLLRIKQDSESVQEAKGTGERRRRRSALTETRTGSVSEISLAKIKR